MQDNSGCGACNKADSAAVVRRVTGGEPRSGSGNNIRAERCGRRKECGEKDGR
jgi:hypothetical protein